MCNMVDSLSFMHLYTLIHLQRQFIISVFDITVFYCIMLHSLYTYHAQCVVCGFDVKSGKFTFVLIEKHILSKYIKSLELF